MLSKLGDWERYVGEYLDNIRMGLESSDEDAARDDFERQDILKLKRKIVETLIERVKIRSDRSLKIVFRLDLLALFNQGSDFSEVGSAEIYTGTSDLTNFGAVFVSM